MHVFQVMDSSECMFFRYRTPQDACFSGTGLLKMHIVQVQTPQHTTILITPLFTPDPYLTDRLAIRTFRRVSKIKEVVFVLCAGGSRIFEKFSPKIV